MAYLSINKTDKIPLFLAKGKVKLNLKGNATDSLIVEGSKPHSAYSKFSKEVKVFDEKMKTIVAEFRKADNDETRKKISEEYDVIEAKKMEYINSYVANNNSSVVSAYVVYRYLGNSSEIAELTTLIENFKGEAASSKYASALNDRIVDLKKTAIGNTIPDFELANTEGKWSTSENSEANMY